MIHLINNSHTKVYSDISSFTIPTQIIFGTKQQQYNLSKEYLGKNNYLSTNPRFYLTRALNYTFNSSLSKLYFNGSISSRVNIITGLTINLINTFVENNRLKIFINPGLLILDSVLINITNPIELQINLPRNELLSGKYDHILITIEYNYDNIQNNVNVPIKFVCWLYDSNTLELYNDLNENWNSNLFIYKTVSLEKDSNLNISLYQCVHEELLINGSIYKTQFYNFYQHKYIAILIEMFGDYAGYFIDIPFLPPLPKGAVYGITELFM